VPKEESRLKAEQPGKVREAEEKARKAVNLAAKIEAMKSREAEEKARQKAEEDRKSAREEPRLPAQRKTRIKDEQMQKQSRPGTTLNATGSVIIIVSNPTSSLHINLFKKSLEKVEGVQIILTGGSTDEGILIGVSLQKPVDLLNALTNMVIVEDAFMQGENIIVRLKNWALR
jgi:hypothetical protein